MTRPEMKWGCREARACEGGDNVQEQGHLQAEAASSAVSQGSAHPLWSGVSARVRLYIAPHFFARYRRRQPPRNVAAPLAATETRCWSAGFQSLNVEATRGEDKLPCGRVDCSS